MGTALSSVKREKVTEFLIVIEMDTTEFRKEALQ
jgi:hypothetical protein